jgi:hypothetical protein
MSQKRLEKAKRLTREGACRLMTTGMTDTDAYARYDVRGDHGDHMTLAWYSPEGLAMTCTCRWGQQRDTACSHLVATAAVESVRLRADPALLAMVGEWTTNNVGSMR